MVYINRSFMPDYAESLAHARHAVEDLWECL